MFLIQAKMMGQMHPSTHLVLGEWCQADPLYLQEFAHPHRALSPIVSGMLSVPELQS